MSNISGRIETVLVVDADDDNRCLLKSIVSLKGLDVLEAANGQEAVDLAFRWRPALIVMALKLPLLSGFSVVRRIKKLASLRDVPIISFAENDPASHHDLALAAGCAAHLDQPMDFDELDILIDRFLPGYSLEFTSLLVH